MQAAPACRAGRACASAIRDMAGNAAAPAARCRNLRRAVSSPPLLSRWGYSVLRPFGRTA